MLVRAAGGRVASAAAVGRGRRRGSGTASSAAKEPVTSGLGGVAAVLRATPGHGSRDGSELPPCDSGGGSGVARATASTGPLVRDDAGCRSTLRGNVPSASGRVVIGTTMLGSRMARLVGATEAVGGQM